MSGPSSVIGNENAELFNRLGNSSSLIDFSHSLKLSSILGILRAKKFNLC